MKKLESTLKNMVMVLSIISVAAGLALAVVNLITSKQIEKINAENLANGIKEVLGVALEDSLNVTTVEDSLDANFTYYYTDTDSEGHSQGTAVKTVKNGFGGPLEVLVGFADDGTIKGYKILSHSETPGLGAKAGEWFQEGQKGNIIGANPDSVNLTVSKDGGDIDAITASTITSRAFLGAVQQAYDKLFPAKADGETGASKKEKGGEQ